jgi:hypothetical protein
VALFAEQFKEMLETRCGRGLLRCLYILEKQVQIYGLANAVCGEAASRTAHASASHSPVQQFATALALLQSTAHMRFTTGQRGEGEEGGGAKGTKGGRAKGARGCQGQEGRCREGCRGSGCR